MDMAQTTMKTMPKKRSVGKKIGNVNNLFEEFSLSESNFWWAMVNINTYIKIINRMQYLHGYINQMISR